MKEDYNIVYLNHKYSTLKNKERNWLIAHGSDKIMGGKLKGQTDSDYFYFKCPECKSVLRVIDVGILSFSDEHPTCKFVEQRHNKKLKKIFTVKLKLYCPKCKLKDIVKISNIGWCGGESFDVVTRSEALEK